VSEEGAAQAAASSGRLSARVRRRLEEQRARLAARDENLDLVIEPLAPEARRVPWGVDLAASWAWRFLVICAAGYLILRVIGFFSVIVLPVVVAMLISALVTPLVRALMRIMPRGIAALIVVILGIGSVALLLTFAGQQVANGAQDLANSTVQGLDKVKDWLKTGPLHASESQIQDYIDQIQKSLENYSKDGSALGRVGEVGTALTHVLAGFFIVLFSTFFFLADGDRIWSWFVRLAPRAARGHVDTSGQVAWRSLTQFVRATVLVAAVDAAGIMIVVAVLGVPFVLAIGVLVFLGAFVPMVGATVAGTVAVLVALVDQGPITALLMLGGVILVQQIEGHVLQPFLMGRFVSVHPLAVIVAIGCGVLVAGVAGALVAVPLAAVVNSVGQHLAAYTDVGDDEPEEVVEEEIAEEDPDSDPVPDLKEGEVGD
jgi:predicted PurR-regulated permease PerM